MAITLVIYATKIIIKYTQRSQHNFRHGGNNRQTSTIMQIGESQCTGVYMQVHLCIYMYIHASLHLHIHVHAYTLRYNTLYIHTYVCAYIHTYKHTYIHAYIHTVHAYIHTYIANIGPPLKKFKFQFRYLPGMYSSAVWTKTHLSRWESMYIPDLTCTAPVRPHRSL